MAEEPSQPEEKVVEFEIVLGRTQVAGVLFVAIVAVVVFSAISYVAGRALVSKPVAAVPVAAVTTPPPAPVVEATIVKPDFPIAEPAPKAPEPIPVPEAPVFANPSANGVYLQMGAVEKGVAVIMVDGLRKRGFSAFAAPGPTEAIFRVLIGPLGDAEGFRKTKEKIDQIGLNSFVRKYQP
ncbi:MAG TPA: SPOR domain-containing protein [Bryobacteraceae bacterium]|nr:SPOR domain-containing protein [Bryobacteraceae bacterium]